MAGTVTLHGGNDTTELSEVAKAVCTAGWLVTGSDIGAFLRR